MASARKTGLRRSPITLSVHYSTSSKPTSKVYVHPQVRCAHQRLRIVEPLQGSACESLLHVAGRNPRPRKAPCTLQDGIAACESFLHVAGRNLSPRKASCTLQDEIAACESFLHVAGRNLTPRKARPRCGDEIPACESSPTAWGRNPGLRKLRHAVGTESRLAKARPRRGEGIAGFIASGSCR